MRIVVLWAGISGYMVACWRAMAGTPNTQLRVIASAPSAAAPFSESMLRGIDHRLLSSTDIQNTKVLERELDETKPDLILISGWANHAYRQILQKRSPGTSRCYTVCVDTPWRNDWRQALGRWPLRRYLGKADTVFVPGERAFTYMRYIGVNDAKIHRGLYGIDYESLAPALAQRAASIWPSVFLFVGRCIEIKGCRALLKAYRTYRGWTSRPWDLWISGTGPLASLFDGQPGIRLLGFVQPTEQLTLFSQAGALVLPSTYDPWPLVIPEACAAGLPIICSNACGSAVELVRHLYNGLLTGTGDSMSLANAMLEISESTALSEWGSRSRSLAEPYSATYWPERVRRHLTSGIHEG